MRQALEGAGRAPVVFGWVIASHVFPLQEVLAGASDLLANVPLIGFTTSGEITPQGRARRSVAVALLCADDIQARAGWWPDFVQDSQACVQTMLQALKPDPQAGESLLVVAEGLNGDNAVLKEALSAIECLPVAGCLSGGELWRGRTFQLGGWQAGSSGLAAAVLSGNVVVGSGAAHGWQPVGALARLTRVQGHWVRTLDGQPASEMYARLFGYPARDWSHAPLNDLVRQYPLGLQEADGTSVYSPLRMEVDGSLRMNVALPEGQVVELMVGSPDSCRQAAAQAARQALETLGPTHPRLAVLLVDAAWQAVLDLDPQAEIEVVRQVIGEDVPLIGGYTFGQIGRIHAEDPVRVLNQHILVLLFGVKNVEVGDVVA
jgi:hypothetical protein